MSSVNKVIILGNCGRDPEIRYLPSGQAVANISIATSTRRKDKNSGEVVEDTQWHRVTFYDRLAEIAGEYIKKGSKLYVEGRLKYGKYTDQSGVEKYTTDIIATEMTMLGNPQDGQGGQGAQQGGQQRQAPQGRAPAAAPQQQNGYAAARGRAQPPAQAPAAGPARQSSGFDDMDDDIPFASCDAADDPLFIDRKSVRAKSAR